MHLKALLAPVVIMIALPAHAATVTLKNAMWRPYVTIDVRIGPHQNCLDDTAQHPQNVALGRSVTLHGTVVCVRHDIDPANATGNWREWTLYEGNIVDEIR
jgi:hypothetical protein